MAVTAFFDSADGWSLLGSRHQLPFSWLRRFIYDKLGWVGGGMFFDDALASILHGAGLPQTMDASLLPETRRIPPGASAAVQLATEAGFLTTPIIDCLELKRFQVSFQDFERPTLRGLLLSPFAWLAILCVSVYLLLPVWGMKWICRCFPALRSRIAGWYTEPQTWPQLALLPLLWLAGLFAGALCITLFIYAIFWPPLFLRLLAKTGDYILVTADSLIFYSAFDQTAAKVPKCWPLLQGRRGKYYVILGNERNTFGSVVPLCVARLPAEWADGLALNVECPGRFLGGKLHAKARLLHEQVRGQPGQGQGVVK